MHIEQRLYNELTIWRTGLYAGIETMDVGYLKVIVKALRIVIERIETELERRKTEQSRQMGESL